jgi:hypothetical protein
LYPYFLLVKKSKVDTNVNILNSKQIFRFVLLDGLASDKCVFIWGFVYVPVFSLCVPAWLWYCTSVTQNKHRVVSLHLQQHFSERN